MRINQWLNAVRHWLTCSPLSTASIDRVQHRRAIRQPGSRGCNLSQALESRTLLTSLVVSTDSDVDDGNYAAGELSLREAINLANADPDPSTITFAPGVRGPQLDGGPLPIITTDLAIVASASGWSGVNGNHTGRILEITGADTDVHIDGVNFSAGDSSDAGGGCILLREGTLRITDSQFSSCFGNQGGAIEAGAETTLLIEGSTFISNRATADGGAILTSGQLNIHTSTFALNSADANGGVLALNNADVTTVNSTFIRNRADDSGGAISASGSTTVTLQNSILAGNYAYTDLESHEIKLSDSAEVAGEHNLIGDPVGAGGLSDGVDGNIVGVDWMSVVRNDGTRPLLTYNNSRVPTTVLLPESPAVDAGRNALATDLNGNQASLDQRGFHRVLDGNNDGAATVDIGAVEAGQGVLETIEVSSLSDIADGVFSEGELSLREAIIIANERAGEDTVTFDSSLSGGTIVLSGSPLPSIIDNTIINGPGADQLTIDGNNTSEIFHVAFSAVRGGLQDSNVHISALTIRNGYYANQFFGGGAITMESQGVLTVTDANLTGNRAPFASGGAIYGWADAKIIVRRSRLSENSAVGGNAISANRVHITESSVFNNSGSAGGAIGSNGDEQDFVRVDNSTIYGNSTDGSGAAISSTATPVVVTNSVISGNSAAQSTGGIETWHGTIRVVNSIVTGNHSGSGGGGIGTSGLSHDARFFVHNSIIAGNNGGAGTPDVRPPLATENLEVLNSLIGDTTGTLLTAGNGNLLDVDWKTVLENDGTDPILTDNGGPTASIALLPNSPAIDAGNNALAVDVDGNPLTTDQRGFSRILDGNEDLIATIDIGPVEVAEMPVGVFEVDNASDISDGDYSDGQLSLREAITLANDQPGVDRITFDAALNGTTILLSGNQLPTVTEHLKIAGLGRDLLTIDGADSSRILETIGEDVNIEVSHLTLQNGNAEGDTGGGAIRVEGGSLKFSNGRIINNRSSQSGGAIDVVAFAAENIGSVERTVYIANSILADNTAHFDGGGIRATDAHVEIAGSTISGNSAGDEGGGVLAHQTVNVSDSTISGNSADNSGGGLVAIGAVSIDNSNVSRNSSALDAGGAFSSTALTIKNSTITENTAGDDIGGVGSNETVTIVDTTIHGNSAGDIGGGVFSATGPLTITSSTISENAGSNGGGIYINHSALVTLADTAIVANTVTGNGGGVSMTQGTFNATNTTIARNTSGNNGGGISAADVAVNIVNSTIAGNSATGVGGGLDMSHYDGIFYERRLLVVHNSIIAGNADDGTAPDFVSPADTVAESVVFNSLIGDSTGTFLTPGNNNLLDIDWKTVLENDGTDTTLADNGGTTPTIALLQGSPAIDAGDNALAVDTEGNPLKTDQRAFPRLLDGDSNGTETVDIGAVEFEDTIAPTLMITPDGTVTSDEPVLFTFQFDEDVTGFETRDVSVVNGDRGNIFAVNGSTYTMDVFPGADGNVTVAVAAGAAVDVAGNESRAASATVSSDTTTPTVSITPDDISTSEAPITFSFEFSEGVSFALDDIALTNGTAEVLTAIDDRTYTLEVTPTADKEVTVSIADDTVMDSAGNSVKAASATVQFDATRPTVSITPHDITITEDPILFTFEFSEEVTGFHQNDINITNGRGETLTRVNDKTYTLQVVPLSPGSVTVSIAAESLTDEFGHANVESSAVVESRISSVFRIELTESTIEEDGSSRLNITRTNYLQEHMTVSLSVSDDTRVLLPTTLEFLSGLASQSASLGTLGGNDVVDGDHIVTITAHVEGFDPATTELTLVDDDSPELALLINAASIIEDEGAAAATAVVSRNTPTELPLVVSLVSSDITEATVPASVTIPAGASSAEFHIDAVDDSEVDENQTVTLEASAAGYVSRSSTIDVINNDSAGDPVILQPSGRVNSYRPEVKWTEVAGAVSYEVWLERLSRDTNPALNRTVERTNFTPDADLGIGYHRIWIRANFSDGTRSGWTKSDFSVDAPVSINALPFHGENRKPTISWAAVAGVEEYRVYVTNLTADAIALDETVTTNSYTPNADFDFGKHRIWVRAIGEWGYVARWSHSVDYYIGPVQIDPIKSTSDSTPAFEWESMANVASVQLYVSQGRNVIVNESGLTTTSFTVPSALEDNLYRWWIRPTHTNGRVGEWSPMGRLEIGERPIVFAPEFNTSDSTIQVAWGDIAGAGSYEIYLYNDDTSSLVDRTTGITGTTYNYHPLPDGNYRVWIRSYTGDGQPDKWSRPHRFVIDAATVDLNVTLLSPLGSTFDTTLDFDWTADADAERYDLYVAHGDTTFEGTNLGISSYQYRNPVSTDRVSWWVRARNSAGEAGPWVKGEADISARPQTIALPGPITEARPTIQWQPVAGAERYTVYISGPDDFVIREQVTETEFTSQVDFESGEHRIWIQAISSGGLRGPWSTVYTIQVDLAENDAAEETDDAFELVTPLEAVPVVHVQTKQSHQQTPVTKPQPDREVEVPVSQNRRKDRDKADSEIGWKLFDEMNWLQKI